MFGNVFTPGSSILLCQMRVLVANTQTQINIIIIQQNHSLQDHHKTIIILPKP